MPRSATKVQTDKHRRRSSVQVISPAAQEQKGEDIIPGHSTRTQWTNMLLQEDADEAVGEILDELLRKVMKGCLDVYTESQVKLRSLSAFCWFFLFFFYNQFNINVIKQILCLAFIHK